LEYYFNNKLENLKYDRSCLYEYYNLTINEIKKSIKSDDRELMNAFSIKASMLLDLLRISEILKKRKDTPYYFPITLCFRGRAYFTSSISFTFHKEIRYCLHQGEYKDNEEPYFHPLNYEVNNIIDKYLYKINELKNYNFKDKNINVLRSIIWVLISISEIKKKDLGSRISILEFLDNAIKMVNSNENISKIDEYDDLKLKSLIKTLDEINKNVYIKRLISKDATASVFQHLIKTLGNDSEDSLM
jgi:DNA-directed RNA polymerase